MNGERAFKRRRIGHDIKQAPQAESLPESNNDSSSEAHELVSESSNEEDSQDDIDEDDGAEDSQVSEQAPANHSEIHKNSNGDRRRKQNTSTSTTTEQHPSSFASMQKTLFESQARDTIDRIVIQPDAKQRAVDKFLRQLKQAIEGIPDRPSKPTRDAEKDLLKKHGVRIPGTERWNAHQGVHELEYCQPTNVNIIGSYALKTCIRKNGSFTIDMHVSMPQTLFTEKDYLNMRYFHKRAYYLASLAAGLSQKKDLKIKLSYDWLDPNHLLPALIVEGEDKFHAVSEAGCKIRIIPALATGSSSESSLFPSSKTLPARNCLRSVSNEQGEPQPTPTYNGAIRANVIPISYLKLMNSAAATCSGYRDACLLGRMWLQQRGFDGDNDDGGFGNFEFSSMVALLLQGGGLSDRPAFSSIYDSQQLFKTTIGLIAHRNLVNQPITIGGSESEIKVTGSRQPVFWDNLRSHNILYKMTSASYQTLRSYAQAATKIFSQGEEASFEQTFIVKENEPLLRADLIVEIKHDTNDLKSGSRIEGIKDVLRQGLTDRINNLDIQQCRESAFPITVKDIEVGHASALLYVSLNAKAATRTVDRGPPAEQKEAASKFASLWGFKAELRRFKDGSIQHSVVWSSSDPNSITKDIITHLLINHKLIQSEKHLHFTNADLSPLSFPLTSGQNTDLLNAFTQLQKDLSSLPSLPLTINSIYPSSSFISSTSVLHPPSLTNPIDLVLIFERSTRWPSHLTAIQATKAAFLLHLQNSIAQHHSHLDPRIGVENAPSSYQNTTFLDIAAPSPSNSSSSSRPHYAFRIRIHHEKESTLLRSALSNLQTSLSDRLQLSKALSEYRLKFLLSPLHTSSITSFATRFPAFSDTSRLLKHWLASHKLSAHFREEAIDLLAARPFVECAPWRNIPGTAVNAFLRCLSMLARWEWTSEPWIVDLSHSSAGSDSVEEREESKKQIARWRMKFEAWRKVDPNFERCTWFVAASNLGVNPLDEEDGDSSNGGQDLWTIGGRPGRVVADRVCIIAKACMKVIRKEGLSLSMEKLFKSGNHEYDFVLKVNKRFHANKRKTVVYKNLVIAREERGASDGHERLDAVVPAFVEELKMVYSDQAVLFFYDETKLDVICGLWNPEASMDRKWKVGIGYPVEEIGQNESDKRIRLNQEAMLAETARLGGDIIDSIELKTASKLDNTKKSCENNQ